RQYWPILADTGRCSIQSAPRSLRSFLPPDSNTALMHQIGCLVPAGDGRIMEGADWLLVNGDCREWL
ncbi:MAG TPA: hypothetical protein VF707_04405, partial [Ardenticatenaceae bacterium]